MTPIAHFTVAELPGTLAVLVFGIVIGAAVMKRRFDALTIGITAFCGLAAVGSVLDHFDGVSATWKMIADLAFLAAGILLLALLLAAGGSRDELHRLDSGRRPN